jgi:outer membrane protein assembly factor BamA
MLGDQNLITMAQVYGSFDNFAGLVAYENRKRRWNWGVAAQQMPYAVGQISAYFATINGQNAYVEDVEIFRQINRELSLFTAYPLNRSRRVELWGGARHVSFTHEIERRGVYSSGQVALDTTIEFPAPASLTLGTASAALVHDNSYFGATSPVLGERWRLEAAPTFGSINYVTALVDYRRYFMPVRPFTLAGRVMHVGRYGSGADDSRLTPLFLGYPHLVRGYDYNSFDTSECGSATTGCPVYDQLIGSRVVVGNAELRFPLFGLLGLGDGYYGALPIEAALFYDAGMAWDQTRDGTVVTSAGATLRMNLFGFAIGQLDYVRPFQRPGVGWLVRLSLTQGF